jgi:hypothetical protein
MSGRFRAVVGLALLAAGLLTDPARAGYVFTNFDLPGSIPGTTTVNGINDNGAVVGFAVGPGRNFINFIRNPDGSFTTLNIGNDTAAVANGINSGNQVVGVSGNGFAFTLSPGSTMPTLLPAPNPGHSASWTAFGVNDRGLIVGQYIDFTNMPNTAPGFIYNPSANRYTLFNPTPSNPINTPNITFAQGINDSGLVVGSFENVNSSMLHGFLFDGNTGSVTLLPNPSNPTIARQGLALVQFLGLNDNGTAVGYYQTFLGNQFGFLFDLATQTYTFLDDPNAAPSPFGAVQTQITGINNAGAISGFYTDAHGEHGFIAFPLALVPEPSTLLLIGTGLLGLLGYRLRRRSATA